MSGAGDWKHLRSRFESTIGSIRTIPERTMTTLGHSLVSSLGADIRIKGLKAELSIGHHHWSTGPHNINIGSKSTKAAAGQSSSPDPKAGAGDSGSKKNS